MSSTLEKIREIVSETSEIPIAEISADSHAINDLEIDSLDFLDIVFAIDKAFNIKLPLETWTKEINENSAPSDDYFVMKNLCAQIDALVAAKAKVEPG